MKDMKKIFILLSSILYISIFNVTTIFAHVVVKPNQVGVATFQTFTIGVPNEKDNNIIGLRLELPDGLQHISPNVKPGWKIEVKQVGEGDEARVTEISWAGGVIPEGQRDEFLFSAQVPATETTLNWKAYQTYSDGSIQTWDQEPVANLTDVQREEMEKTGKGPYSQTKIINDLKGNTEKSPSASNTNSQANKLFLLLSFVSIVISCTALWLSYNKGKTK